MTSMKLSLLLALLATLSLVPQASAAIPAHLHPKRHLFENPHKETVVKRQQNPNRTYPTAYAVPSPSLLPQAWTDALNEAISNGKIPNIPSSTVTSSGGIVYPSGYSDKQIGSWTNSKIVGPNDIADAPEGVWGVDFDDGPVGQSVNLYKYLQSQNQSATHFLIGTNIATHQDAFDQLAQMDQQMAVHTWSHSLQTALTNEQVLGELAWTMQIIYDRSGKIPNLWRPPQGDVDNRVRAIAEEVLGLQCVLWVADSNDWCLGADYKTECPPDNTIGASYESVASYIKTHVTGSKSPGIILLEHEIEAPSLSLFQGYYPTLRENGWTPEPIGNFDQAKAWYANGLNASTPTTGQTGMLLANQVSATSSSSSSSTSSSTGTSMTTGTQSSNGAQPTSSTMSATEASQSEGTTSSTNGAMSALGLDQSLCAVASLAISAVLAALVL
ncbi:glycoside hydrolase/deacetylase [Microstroma glucosiphilum]|uniref:chitin deacetylase n=1 Tax=Pseudomicrostroma glucosiphilum TaxID=1684307 RepID=A0A316UEQ1_9BASI|nr:glycoside hydrolase/deacetylase [Pseudomicrostroma glucosiphilum]PWN23700.1 glycoside hydrolase/deacetylase [Pseudomicrostroma glucosiphilum]